MDELQWHNFKSGKIVSPKDFFGREEAIRTIFARIHNYESAAVIGEPQIGKSSLLHYIAHEDVWPKRLGVTSKEYCFIEMDCHLFPLSYQPSHFWKHVLDQMEANFREDWLRIPLEVVRNSFFGSFTLIQLFELLAEKERYVVLLIDQFDTLLQHPNFNTAEFFGSLRSISSRISSLLLIITSRMSVAEMQRRSREINPLGSPFFNNLVSIRLPRLLPEQVDQVLDRGLEGTTVHFSPEDRAYIKRVTGGQPYLVQIAGAALFDAIVSKKKRDLWHKNVLRTLRNQESGHFEEVWRYLPGDTQQVVAILASAELGRPDSADKVARLGRYASELGWLAESRFIEQTDDQQCPMWDSKRWRLSTRSFAEWAVNNARIGSQNVPDPVQPVDRTKLHRMISQHFNNSELEMLCSDLQIDFESLPGQGKANKALQLVAYCERHGRLSELRTACRQRRPKFVW